MPETPNPKSREPLPPPIAVAKCALDYAELDVTSNFSFLRGASHPDELVYTAAELGYRAIALTDRNTLAGVVRAHSAAKSCGMKLVVGSRVCLSGLELLVWAPDRAAYARLCRLLTFGKRRVAKGEFQLSLEEFIEHSEGLITACDFASVASIAARNGREIASDPGTLSTLRTLRDAFGNRLSLAFSRLYYSDHESVIDPLLRLSRRTGIPLLATNAVHYHDPGRRALQDVLVCIREGCTIQQAGFKLFPNVERYLKSPGQMHRLFADFPQAIRRGIEIAERCEFRLDSLKYEYPHELVPPGQTPRSYLAELTWTGAQQRYPAGIPGRVRSAIEHELRLIAELNYEAYFLTVYDL